MAEVIAGLIPVYSHISPPGWLRIHKGTCPTWSPGQLLLRLRGTAAPLPTGAAGRDQLILWKMCGFGSLVLKPEFAISNQPRLLLTGCCQGNSQLTRTIQNQDRLFQKCTGHPASPKHLSSLPDTWCPQTELGWAGSQAQMDTRKAGLNKTKGFCFCRGITCLSPAGGKPWFHQISPGSPAEKCRYSDPFQQHKEIYWSELEERKHSNAI